MGKLQIWHDLIINETIVKAHYKKLKTSKDGLIWKSEKVSQCRVLRFVPGETNTVWVRYLVRRIDGPGRGDWLPEEAEIDEDWLVNASLAKCDDERIAALARLPTVPSRGSGSESETLPVERPITPTTTTMQAITDAFWGLWSHTWFM